MHPVSTATRPVRLLIAENGIKCDEEMVDILKGAHYQEPYASLNPNRLVPMLEDGDLRLTESSAIRQRPACPKRISGDVIKTHIIAATQTPICCAIPDDLIGDVSYGLQETPLHREPSLFFLLASREASRSTAKLQWRGCS